MTKDEALLALARAEGRAKQALVELVAEVPDGPPCFVERKRVECRLTSTGASRAPVPG